GAGRGGGGGAGAMMVDPEDSWIEVVVAAAAPDILQLHGCETPTRAAAIGGRWGRRIMKAIPVSAAGDAEAALAYTTAAQLILFDARAPAGATRPGGNGAVFPWQHLAGVKDKVT